MSIVEMGRVEECGRSGELALADGPARQHALDQADQRRHFQFTCTLEFWVIFENTLGIPRDSAL